MAEACYRVASRGVSSMSVERYTLRSARFNKVKLTLGLHRVVASLDPKKAQEELSALATSLQVADAEAVASVVAEYEEHVEIAVHSGMSDGRTAVEWRVDLQALGRFLALTRKDPDEYRHPKDDEWGLLFADSGRRVYVDSAVDELILRHWEEGEWPSIVVEELFDGERPRQHLHEEVVFLRRRYVESRRAYDHRCDLQTEALEKHGIDYELP